MKALISDIIERFGPREAGSTAELDAQSYLEGILKGFCDTTERQEFSIPLRAKFESLKIFCAVFYLSLVLFWFDQHLALLLSWSNTILYMGHFVTYHNWLDFLFKKGKSINITGIVEPIQEVKKTIIVSGHMDSAREFIWWYRLKHPGIVITVFSGFVISLLPLLYTGIWIAELTSSTFFLTDVSVWIWWLFVALAPTTITLFNIHGRNVVPGAQDNLSGITLATEIGKHFSKEGQRLQHTRIRVVSFGSEEIGLRGSQAYARAVSSRDEKYTSMNINLDGIKDKDHLTILEKEISVHAKYPEAMVEKAIAAFESCNTPYKVVPLLIGATDGASFVREEIPSVTIIGQSTEQLDPTYHTRLDVPECVDPEALEDMKKVLVRWIGEEDEIVKG